MLLVWNVGLDNGVEATSVEVMVLQGEVAWRRE
jgi:hypothetical protein